MLDVKMSCCTQDAWKQLDLCLALNCQESLSCVEMLLQTSEVVFVINTVSVLLLIQSLSEEHGTEL